MCRRKCVTEATLLANFNEIGSNVASVTQAPLGGSTFKPLNSAGQLMLCICNCQGPLLQIRVETLIGFQANYEIQIKITIYFYKIMISYEKYSTLNLH